MTLERQKRLNTACLHAIKNIRASYLADELRKYHKGEVWKVSIMSRDIYKKYIEFVTLVHPLTRFKNNYFTHLS